MGKPAKCPGGCGVTLDYDAVPGYSNLRQRAGKFCPQCGHPLDEETAKADVLEYGPESAAVMANRAAAAADFFKASATPPAKVPA